MNHFKEKQFQKDVIVVAVGCYLRYNLSYRDVQEMLYARGVHVCHTTICRWVQEYGKILYGIWKKKNRQALLFVENGRNLYQDKREMALFVSCHRCRRFNTGYLATQEAYAFLKRLEKNKLYVKTEHPTVKYLNNLIEQDHRPIKRRNKFYRSLRTASTTIKGMEAVRGIYKKI